MNSTQIATAEKLNLLLQGLLASEPLQDILSSLTEIAQDDLVSRSVVSYIARHIDQAGSKLAKDDLVIFIKAFQNLQDSPIDDKDLIAELVLQAQQLEAKTSIYPSSPDGFDDFTQTCAGLLDQLILSQRSGLDIAAKIEELREVASSYGMFRLMKYIDRWSEEADAQAVKTLILQGQEHLIGQQEVLGELLESTTLTATAADWGVEEFLVDPVTTQETDSEFVSFFDQVEEKSQSFDSLFEEEEPIVAESTTEGSDSFSSLFEEEEPIVAESTTGESESFSSLFEEEEP
ncbi:MAG: hypothetical protein CV045_11660, partial [Cyanobacteria bacterium M5B4]